MLDLLMDRRSIRRFEEREIGEEVKNKLIQGILTSPSGKNIRPWEIVLVEDRDLLEKLGETRNNSSKPVYNSAMTLVIIGDEGKSDIWIEDASILATISQLLGQSLGLGSCWVQVRNRFDDKGVSISHRVREILGIQDNYSVECMVAFGYPAEEKEGYKKEDLNYEKVHYNRF